MGPATVVLVVSFSVVHSHAYVHVESWSGTSVTPTPGYDKIRHTRCRTHKRVRHEVLCREVSGTHVASWVSSTFFCVLYHPKIADESTSTVLGAMCHLLGWFGLFDMAVPTHDYAARGAWIPLSPASLVT